jgi:hypothetical protein
LIKYNEQKLEDTRGKIKGVSEEVEKKQWTKVGRDQREIRRGK